MAPLGVLVSLGRTILAHDSGQGFLPLSGPVHPCWAEKQWPHAFYRDVSGDQHAPQEEARGLTPAGAPVSPGARKSSGMDFLPVSSFVLTLM